MCVCVCVCGGGGGGVTRNTLGLSVLFYLANLGGGV